MKTSTFLSAMVLTAAVSAMTPRADATGTATNRPTRPASPQRATPPRAPTAPTPPAAAHAAPSAPEPELELLAEPAPAAAPVAAAPSANTPAAAAPVAAAPVATAPGATAPAAPHAASDAPLANALPLRRPRPLSLAVDSGHGNSTRVFLVLGAALAALWFWARRRKPAVAPVRANLAIVRKVSLGARSSLIIVEADGQRLLLGVTPGAVQCLAVLTDPADALAEAPANALASEPDRADDAETAAARRAQTSGTVVRRFDAMLDAAQSPARPAARGRAAAKSPPAGKLTRRDDSTTDDDSLDEQARGLRALGGGA